MSGRKKNRKHHRGQPPHELLNELNSLRELLGSEEAEADIPLLDQVADTSTAEVQPPHQPTQPPRPLEEADLPILFSPVDEEPEEEFAVELSDADRKLLRPLQTLPRTPEPTQPLRERNLRAEADEADREEPRQSPAQQSIENPPQQAVEPPAPRQEFQPELFGEDTGQADATAATLPLTQAEQRAAASENPFLPPHIRARLTGGKIPRSGPEQKASEEREERESLESSTDNAVTETVKPAPDARASAAEQLESTEDNTRLNKEEREALIEQLMAEQLPELEQQLRLSITIMVEGLYGEAK